MIEPESSGDDRGGVVNLVAWLVAVGGIAAVAGAIAWAGSSVRFELREVDGVDLFPERAAEAPLVDGPPRWREEPAPRFPRRAMRAGVTSGEVVVGCVTRRSGRVRDCEIVSETPEGYGFGRAAVRAANRSRVYPNRVDGQARRGRIQFTIRFQMAEASAAQSAPQPAP